jgi:hypothetical protein
MTRLSVPRLTRRGQRAILIVLAALVWGSVALPVASFADEQANVAGVHLDRPLDGVGDSPLVP